MYTIAHHISTQGLMPVLLRVLAAESQIHASRMCGMLTAHDSKGSPTPTGYYGQNKHTTAPTTRVICLQCTLKWDN